MDETESPYKTEINQHKGYPYCQLQSINIKPQVTSKLWECAIIKNKVYDKVTIILALLLMFYLVVRNKFLFIPVFSRFVQNVLFIAR